VTYAIFKNALNIHRVMGAQVSNVTAIPVKWQFQAQLQMDVMQISSGKLSHNYGKPPFLMGKSTLNFYTWQFSIATSWFTGGCHSG